MRILVTGALGQLGRDVIKRLELTGAHAIGVDVGELDITDESATRRLIEAYAPECVIHCAAYTDVNRAEDEPERCFAVNVGGTRNVALGAKDAGASMIYISTDYVFDGRLDRPYLTDDDKAPLSVYGEAKSQGEEAVKAVLDKYFIVRTSWVFGNRGNNFVRTMLRLGAMRDTVSVVNDQIGSPTYTADLARLLVDMASTERFGTYHATNDGYCSWYEFASEIMRLSGTGCRVEPVASADYPSRAVRPLNSRLDRRSLAENGFVPLPHWRDGLRAYLDFLNTDGTDAHRLSTKG